MNLHQLTSETFDNKFAPPKMSPDIDGLEDLAKPRALRVYLVEDSPHVRDLLLDFLNVPGEIEIVGHADTEHESLADMLVQPVDAVIVDLRLREGTGMGLIEKLRKASLALQPKIIVFTNHPFAEIRKRAMELGADYFFDKSADYERVRDTLQNLRSH